MIKLDPAAEVVLESFQGHESRIYVRTYLPEDTKLYTEEDLHAAYTAGLKKGLGVEDD